MGTTSDHGNLNARPPIEPKANAALCLAVSNGQLGEVKAQIEAGVDVNDTCQTTTLWYNGLTPLAIAMKRGRTEIEAILVEAGAVNTVSSAPDLVVNTPTVSDSSPDAGASFTLSATVRNQGDGSSDSTTLRYYRSTDSSISTSDTEVGTDSVGGLAASGSSPESINLTAPSTAGTYYYGACVDAVSGESDTENNCSAAVRVSVTAAPAAGTCRVGLVVRPGESCTYPGTTEEFWVDSSGRGRFLGFTAGTAIVLRNTNVNGVIYTFVARKQDSGTWLVEEVG